MTQKEIFIIKAIWGSDSQDAKKNLIKNVKKHLIIKNKKLKSELS